MAGKQYGTPEKIIIWAVSALIGAFVTAVLLGVCALATLVF